MNTIQGTVTKAPGKVFVDNYGKQKQTLKVTLSTGQVETIYFTANKMPEASLQLNEPIELTFGEYNGRRTKQINRPGQSQQYAQPQQNYQQQYQPQQQQVNSYQPQQHQYQAPKKPTATEWAIQEASNLANLYLMVEDKFKSIGKPLSSEEIRNLAVSINIGLQRQYTNQQDIVFTREVKQPTVEQNTQPLTIEVAPVVPQPQTEQSNDQPSNPQQIPF